MHCKRSLIFVVLLIGVAAFMSCNGSGDKRADSDDTPTRPEKVVVSSPDPNLEEMVGISPVIFHGTVIGVRFGDHEGTQQPYTFVQFGGVEFLRRDSKPPVDKNGILEISYLGGLLDDGRRLEVSVSPYFEIGKRYLVFLRGGGWRLSPIPGVNKGVFRLIGRIQGDPVVATSGGVPIGEFVEGRPITARRVSLAQEENGIERGVRVEEIPPGDEREARIAPRKALGAEEAEKREAAEQAREADTTERVVKEDPSDKEYVAGLKGRWTKVMRLSELKGTIEELAKRTQGKYPEFERVFSIPVPEARQQNLPGPSREN
ncbi:MAG: hypothetical protein JSV33_02250 [bacterium]|nr:MAG: hypothetical protein JSV33_02250 [bacterium]